MMDQGEFKNSVFSFYQKNIRVFPWRQTQDPYSITVSEFMLQQTQTERVIPKYEAFLKKAPTWRALAALPITELLFLWQGLGYNRRALALQKTAQIVMNEYKGSLPASPEKLVGFPGIGPYTAAAICVFSFNLPLPMIETNIRRVYLHHFFPEREEVSDKELLPLITETIDQENPREWYYALMDYGAWLAKQLPNPNRRSRHYTKQSTFTGSNRQLRGKILKLTLEGPLPSPERISELSGFALPQVLTCLSDLRNEGFPIPQELKNGNER